MVIGTRFGDISAPTLGRRGLLVAVVTEEDCDKLWAAIEADLNVETTVDLPTQTISRGDLQVNFEIDEYTKHRLLNGLDDISLTPPAPT